MQTARCFVNIGGEVPHTVPKNNVTPAELALLQAIHGADAVHDVQIVGKSTRSNRDERARLAFTYGKAVDNQQRPFIDTLFPGVTSKLPTEFDDLGLPDEMYAAERKAPKPKRHDEDDQPSDAKAQAQVAEDTIGRTKGRKGRSTRSAATGTGLKGKADGPDPRAPTGKGGAGSLGSEGGVDGEGHMPPDDDGDDDNDGVKDILD